MNSLVDRLMRWLGSGRMLSAPRRYIGKMLAYYFLRKNIIYIKVVDPKLPEIADLIMRIRKETELLMSNAEAYHLYSIAKKTEKIDGDIAEVGVYKGGSVRLICEATKKQVHLFDTFDGLPGLSTVDDGGKFNKGMFSSSLESVSKYLGDRPNVHFHKGLFPSTAESVKSNVFSLVHLDVDIHGSTLDGLKFFYPRMSRGGVLVTHDYHYSKGVTKAIDDFFNDKPEIVIDLPGCCGQCLVIKV